MNVPHYEPTVGERYDSGYDSGVTAIKLEPGNFTALYNRARELEHKNSESGRELSAAYFRGRADGMSRTANRLAD